MRKFITLLAFMATSINAYAEDKNMQDQDANIAAIATIVESVGALADRNEFDALSRLYADEFTLDYSSLNGQPATQKKPLELMAEWASVLPGFDRTRHALSNVAVELDGDNATATADVVASHWVDGGFWQVSGRYDYALEKFDAAWKITSMTFTLQDEKGSREVFGPAIEAAKTRNLEGHNRVVAERNKEAVRTLLKLLEDENIPAFVNMFAADGVQVNPYTGGVLPEGAKGKEGLLAYWSPVPDRFDGMKFTIEELLATEDPSVVFTRFRGELKLKDGAGVYTNNYYSTFKFNDEGLITEYVEIFDPVVAARGFGLLDQIK